MVKYPVTLFILLLIGYSQLFTPFFKENAVFSPVENLAEAKSHFEALPVKANENETIYFEEEEEEDDERSSFRKYSEDFAAFLPSFLTGNLLWEVNHHSSVFSFSAPLSFSRSPYLLFCVFRL